MAFYRQVGRVPPKRHTQFRRPDGGLYSEELMGEEGFSSDSSLLYHAGIPSALVTNTVRPLVEIALGPLVDELFDVSVCGLEVQHAKPAPDPYLASLPARVVVPVSASCAVDVSATTVARTLPNPLSRG